MKQLHVKIPGNEYRIDIGFGIFAQQLIEELSSFPVTNIVVVTNPIIQKLYSTQLNSCIQKVGLPMQICVIPDGEEHKTMKTLQTIYDFLLEHRANRQSLLLAFGGGVIGDITGFAAATFMRGVPFIQVPTTLLSFVDSSVGGKTAVNHPLGKNTIGAFKQPKYVCMELGFLATLPIRERKAGYFELVKHGIIHNADLFEFVQNRPLEPLDYEFLEEAVFRSCQVKSWVVEQDEKELGLRATLNFGHTLGHLIETHTGYGTYLHGEAVGLGMLFAAFVSHREKQLEASAFQAISALLIPLLTPVILPLLEESYFHELILHDKKSQNQAINFIMLTDIGSCFVKEEYPIQGLWQHFQQFLQEYPQYCQIQKLTLIVMYNLLFS